MKNNIENNKKLALLIKQNPDLPIITATHWAVVREDWGYWRGEIRNVKVDYFYLNSNKEQWEAGDEEEIKETLYEEYEENVDIDKDLGSIEVDKIIDNTFEEYKEKGIIEKAIIIYITI